MKSAFGIVTLLLSLAIVAFLLKTQLEAVKAPAGDHGPDTAAPLKQVQKARDDISKSLQDAADARRDAIDK